MQVTVELPEAVSLNEKLDLVIGLLREQGLKDIFCEVFDTEEACRYLKINRRYLHTLKENKEIAYSQHGKIVRYRRADLDRWLDEHRVSRK